jgi:CRISPR-associated endonuclease Cas1
MQQHSSISNAPESIPIRNGILVLRGYGLALAVEHGRLLLRDGLAASRRESRFTKATCGIKRLVIIGHSGLISLEAVRWLCDIGAALVQIDADGKLLFASSPRSETYSQIRRAQAMAAFNGTGVSIVKGLLAPKLSGQARIAGNLGQGEAEKAILDRLQRLDRANAIGSLKNEEAQAASVYWRSWSDVPVRFARRDAAKIPLHWRTFSQRLSPLTGSPRGASNPANAMLNYLYAILEAETRIALLTIGLDPGMGFLHADQAGRDSLALDVMEPIRPVVDQWLLDFIQRAYFAKRDFFERRDGTVRISSQIAALLVGVSPILTMQVAPFAEWVAQAFSKSLGEEKLTMPTPLTEKHRSAGRERYKSPDGAVSESKAVAKALKTCLQCGRLFHGRSRRFCSRQCFQAYNMEVIVPRLAEAGPRRLAAMRGAGVDPAQSPPAGKKRGEKNAAHAKERATWENNHPEVDIEEEKRRFKSDICPKLARVPLGRITKMTGLSKRYASMIRRGLYIPHPRHYRILEEIATEAGQHIR